MSFMNTFIFIFSILFLEETKYFFFLRNHLNIAISYYEESSFLLVANTKNINTLSIKFFLIFFSSEYQPHSYNDILSCASKYITLEVFLALTALYHM